METLSSQEARKLRADIYETLSPEALACLGASGVGLCLVSQDPPAFGVKLELRSDADTSPVFEAIAQLPDVGRQYNIIAVQDETRPSKNW